ncbi:hypothetical protein CYMTET_35624 [Cymbomonas tetramitiformis]|uniref:Uncharacterized protein n=1 Tax=Cymbomonas tetramitiformis TaxID=36881 RepID=A0AAE0KNJ4_9CHLO|nr:hypothetical protein CYMTET_35624 [Cymbomonas tetramitiformis]
MRNHAVGRNEPANELVDLKQQRRKRRKAHGRRGEASKSRKIETEPDPFSLAKPRRRSKSRHEQRHKTKSASPTFDDVCDVETKPVSSSLARRPQHPPPDPPPKHKRGGELKNTTLRRATDDALTQRARALIDMSAMEPASHAREPPMPGHAEASNKYPEWIRTLASALTLASNNVSPIKQCVERVLVDQTAPRDVVERLMKALKPHGRGGTVKMNNGKALKDNIKFELLKHVPSSERDALRSICDEPDAKIRIQRPSRVRIRKPPPRIETANKNWRMLLEDVQGMPSNNAGPIKKLITAAVEKCGANTTVKEALQHLLTSASYDNNSCGSLKTGVAALLRTCANGQHIPLLSTAVSMPDVAPLAFEQNASVSPSHVPSFPNLAQPPKEDCDTLSSFYRAVLSSSATTNASWDPQAGEEDMCYVTAGYGKGRYAYAMRCDMQTMEKIFKHVWSLDRSPLSDAKLQITGLPHLIAPIDESTRASDRREGDSLL